MSDPVLAEAIGTVDGVNTDFQTPVAYQAGTVWLFLNGQLIPRENDDGGLIELGGSDVRLKQAPVTDDRVHFWFHTGPPTPGAFSTPPRGIKALELKPDPWKVLELSPSGKSVEGGTAATDYVPRGTVALELSPDPEISLELTPNPVTVEEV